MTDIFSLDELMNGKKESAAVAVGTEIYYRGDMANPEDYGEIIQILPASKHGPEQALIRTDDGREFVYYTAHISAVDSGNGSTRVCTKQAHEAFREERIRKMQKDRERLLGGK